MKLDLRDNDMLEEQEHEKAGIAVDNLTKTFGAVHALRGFSARFEPGSLNGIIGPDGAGKTTLMRLIAGLLKPTSGTVRYYTENKEVSFNELKEYIAYMPSKAVLYPDLSIEEHLIFFKNLYSLSSEYYREKSDHLLSVTRLAPFKGRRIKELSGGMYKKVGLMCALLRSPKILLLDEPTNGVDPISRREFWELLYRLRDDGILIMLNTAYMDEAERCTAVYFIEEGKLIRSGKPMNILKEEGIKSFNALFGA